MKHLSAGAAIVRLHEKKWEYLLLRSFKYWDFPKGMVEAGEEPWDAALREVSEETSLTKFSTPWGKDYFETEPYGRGKVARYYLLKSEEDKEIVFIPNPVTGIIEHHEYRWVSYEDAHELLGLRVQKALNWAHAKIDS